MTIIFSSIATLVALAWLAAVVLMFIYQDAFVFHPEHLPTRPEFESARWDVQLDDVRLQGWFIDRGADRTVIYYGGNAEDLAGLCAPLQHTFNANILLVNYRGYGKSEGTPGEKEIISDSLQIFDRFCEEKSVNPASIILVGRSIGTGVAVQMADARPNIAGVILITPYSSIVSIGQARFPWLPIGLLLKHPFQSIDHAPRIQTSALMLLAEFDRVTPINSGRKLAKSWGGAIQTVELPAGHNSISENPLYYEAIKRFVDALTVPAQSPCQP